MRFGVPGPLPAQITGREGRLDGPRQAALLVDANSVVAMERLIAVMRSVRRLRLVVTLDGGWCLER